MQFKLLNSRPLSFLIEAVMICGGTSEAKEMTQEVIDVCHKVKADVETKAGTKFDVFEPKSFKSQVSTWY